MCNATHTILFNLTIPLAHNFHRGTTGQAKDRNNMDTTNRHVHYLLIRKWVIRLVPISTPLSHVLPRHLEVSINDHLNYMISFQ